MWGLAPSYHSLRFVTAFILVSMQWTTFTQAKEPGFDTSSILVSPERVVLDGPESTQQILVSGRSPELSQRDLTHQVRYEVVNKAIASITTTGLVEPRSEGKTELLVHYQAQVKRVPLEVRGLLRPLPVSFEQQIIPLLTKASCNSGGCHGKAEGQNGFKLSVFGFDPVADHRSIIAESRGRRLFPAAPEKSLLVEKAIGSLPHGGGKKLQKDSLAYKRLIRWITEGSRYHTEEISPIVRLEVEPSERILPLGGSQQLRVTAIDEHGKRHCVTAETEFDSNAPTIAGADERGHVQAGQIPGEAAILVRYMGQVTVSRITIPRANVTFTRPPENNFIDGHVWNKLKRLGIPPSELCDDATFLRRVHLDTIGTLPTSTESRSFLNSTQPDKRSRLIDQLLSRPEYADYWAMRWSDVLRVDRDILLAPGAVAITTWLRQQFGENRPYDQFVHDILTAEGNIQAIGPAGLFKALGKPEEMSRSISQLFLGVRIECAQCHHHPSDRWGQDDYFALAGFFTGLSRKNVVAGSEAIRISSGTDLKHPRTGMPIPTRALGAPVAQFEPDSDRRAILAKWMISPDNPYFARTIVNRIWAHYLGRGLIEPIDDLRATNPATNEPLLDALTRHFIANKYDLKDLIRTILSSRVYQLAGAIPANETDEQHCSHARPRTLPAEVLLDAICQVTGVPEKFNGWPEGVRAIQMWDNRMPSYFLKLFGRPVRTSVCECERSGEPSIAQALHLMNAPEIADKIHSRRGVARQLADSRKTPREIIEELYLGVLNRYPREAEQETLLELFPQEMESRRAAVEDVLWAILNTKEFLYNR